MSPMASRHAAGSLARRESGSARGAAVNTWNRNGLRRVGFSGPLRAGLIEATMTAYHEGERGEGFSGPLRAGLIEAA